MILPFKIVELYYRYKCQCKDGLISRIDYKVHYQRTLSSMLCKTNRGSDDPNSSCKEMNAKSKTFKFKLAFVQFLNLSLKKKLLHYNLFYPNSRLRQSSQITDSFDFLWNIQVKFCTKKNSIVFFYNTSLYINKSESFYLGLLS